MTDTVMSCHTRAMELLCKAECLALEVKSLYCQAAQQEELALSCCKVGNESYSIIARSCAALYERAGACARLVDFIEQTRAHVDEETLAFYAELEQAAQT